MKLSPEYGHQKPGLVWTMVNKNYGQSMTRRLTTLTFKRRLRFWAGAWVFLVAFYCVTRWSGLVRWHIPKLPPNFYQESPAFLQVRNSDTYLYSALTNMAPQGAPDSVALTKDPNRAVSSIVPTERKVRVSQSYGYIVQELDQDLEIIITGLDRSRSWASSFVCCVKTGKEDGRTEGDARPTFTTTARTYFEYVKPFSWERWIKEYWLAYSPSVYVASQYSCRIPRKHLSPSNMPMFATLAPMPSLFAKTLSPLLLLSWLDLFWGFESYCPREGTEYLPVEYPDKVPDGLGLCSKVNHNSPNPEVILEWLELQRHLGVDRVVVYDMGNNSPQLNRLFLHYEKTGLVERKWYDLPGEPRGRSLEEDFKRTAQFTQDETLAVLECRVRLSGHGMVLSMDKDEVLVPRRDVSLKTLLKSLFLDHPSAASLVFPTQFFITTWEPTNPEEETVFLRYRRTRLVRWECWKYAFLPGRVRAAVTHEVFPINGYSLGDRISEREAILHHYRGCPKDTWGTCKVSTTVDNTMTRYKATLTNRIREVKASLATEHQEMEGEEMDSDKNGSMGED